MRKKFQSMEKEVLEHKENARKMTSDMAGLNTVIRNQEKDIVALKKEIQERDDTIQGKVCMFNSLII